MLIRANSVLMRQTNYKILNIESNLLLNMKNQAHYPFDFSNKGYPYTRLKLQKEKLHYIKIYSTTITANRVAQIIKKDWSKIDDK